MKKTMALISAAVIALTLTACNNTDNTSSTPNSSAPVSSAASQPASSAVSSAAPDSSDVPAGSDGSASVDAPAQSGDDSADVPASPDDSIVVPDDPNNPGDPDEGADNSALVYPDNRAGRMVKAAISTGPWSGMSIMQEDEVPFSFPDLKIEDCEEYCIAYCPMSAQLQYAIAVKPKAGGESVVKTVFENFIQAKKDDHMLYPSLQPIAESAVLGEDGGYIYVVFHENSQTVADAMAAAQ